MEASAATVTTPVRTTYGNYTYDGSTYSGYPSSYFKVTMHGASTSGTNTMYNDELTSWTWYYIKVVDVDVREHISFKLYRNNSLYSSKTLSDTGNLTLYSGSLPDGEYRLEYVCNIGNWFSNKDYTYTYRFEVDKTAPTATLKAGGSTISSGTYTNKQVVYSATDANTVRIRVQSPSASGYSTSYNSSYTVAATTANNGWWYVYALDPMDNSTSAKSFYMDTVAPVGKVTNSSGTTISNGGYTNKAVKYTATDTGGVSYLQVKTPGSSSWTSYTSGTALSSSYGWYTFRAVDKAGNISTEYKVYYDAGVPTGTLYGGTSSKTSGSYTNACFVTELLNSGNLKTGKGLSPNSVNAIITVMQNSLKTAYALGYMSDYTADKIKRPKTGEKKVECFSSAEQKKMEQYILNKDKAKLFGILLCLYSGLRIGELLALEWTDVDFAKGELRVNKTCHDGKDKDGVFTRITDVPKTQSSIRIIPLPKQFMPLLREAKRKSHSIYIVSNGEKPISIRSYQRTFATLQKNLEIPHKGFHCEAYYNIPINCVNESVEYHQVKTFFDLYNKLCLVKDEIENRMNMMQKAGIRELDKYQEIAEENRFPQIIIGINELFHLTDNRDKQNKEEEEYECLCLNLLKEFSRWGARFGVYFLFSFRYSCYPHLMRNLEHFTSSMYYWHYNGEIEYYDRDFESAVKNLQKNEILIQPNRTQNSFYECKMFGF